MIKIAAATATAIALFSVSAFAQVSGPTAQLQSSLPADSITVTHWYKQSVYDPSDAKVGEIMDVLVNKSGQVTALIVGVGGFLGAGEKDVAVPLASVQTTTKDDKPHLVISTTKDALKAAPGFAYDKNHMTWSPDSK